MLLANALSVNLAVTAVLSIFMLQLGSDSETSILLPFLSIPMIGFAVYWVDIKKKRALTEGWMNLLVLAVVGFHLKNLIQSPSAFLAYSIANILAWIEIILFFRKKDVLTLYHILTLSFVNGGVACVFQQSSVFAPILLGFSFSVLISVSLLFLNQERVYYRSHAFLKSAFARGEKIKRVTVGHLAVLAVKTAVVLPLMILLGYRWKEWLEKSSSEKTVTVHSPDEEFSGGDGLFAYWESTDGRVISRDRREGETVSAVLPAADSRRSERTQLRWPLLRQTPMFSGGRRREDLDRVGRGYFFRLLAGAFFSLLAGGLIFIFFPRFDSNQMEVGRFRFGHDQWKGAARSVRSVTGFNEQVRLGEMGPSGNNFESVMRIRLTDRENEERPVLQKGDPVYLRGTILTRYDQSQWFAPEPEKEDNSFLLNRSFNRGRKHWSLYVKSEESQQEPGHLFWSVQEADRYGRYSTKNRLVQEEIRLEPMTTPLIFTVWPFFQLSRGFGFVRNGRYFRSDNDASKVSNLTLYTNAFSPNGQDRLTPVQKGDAGPAAELLDFSPEIFPQLTRIAQEWDRESNLPKDDTAGRAQYIESRLRDSGEYAYTRSGVTRESGIDPLEDFIALHKSGHCEYFAGALTLLLRAVGIPARMVAGFAVSYNPDGSGFTVVRQSDAHTWVEALIEPDALPPELTQGGDEKEKIWWRKGGWLRLDAVPPQEMEVIRSFSIQWRSWREWVQTFWSEYIMNYGSSRQRSAVYEPVAEGFRNLGSWLGEIGDRINPFGHGPFSDADDGAVSDKTQTRRPDRFIPIVGLAVLCGILLGLWRLKRRYRTGSGGGMTPQRRSERTASLLWGRLERLAARLGSIRERNETPREFLDRFLTSPAGADFCRTVAAEPSNTELSNSEPETIGVLRRILEVYYQVRFGMGRIGESDQARFDRFFYQAETALRNRRSENAGKKRPKRRGEGV